MHLFRDGADAAVEREVIPLELLSQELRVSMQTLLRWVDRRVIDGSVRWVLTDDNEELRVIDIRKDRHSEIEAFAKEYRQSAVTHKQARRILKMIDRKRVQRLVQKGDLEAVETDHEKKMRVGSIEDYLMGLERAWSEA